MGETLSDLGEFGLIGRLLARVPTTDRSVVVGAGDDAAVLQVGDRRLIATTDLLVEGRHFDLNLCSPADAGWKALTVNVSDVAAMGGRPLWALVSLGAPADTPAALLDELYDGVGEAAAGAGVTVAGGDTVAAPMLLVSIALLGEPGAGGVVTRSGAIEGDLLCLTGTLGGAAAGLALLRRAGESSARTLLDRFPALAAAHRRPNARVREGLAAAAASVHAMIDISDGLQQDAGHLAAASGVGVIFEPDPPRAPGVVEVEAWLADAAPSLAEAGGDDYELAMAVAPDGLDRLREAIAPTPLTVVGRFAGPVGRGGIPGWDSFRDGP